MKKLFYIILFAPLALIAQENHSIVFDGINREYLVYIPEIYDSSKEYPVLFNFHGGSGYANDFINTNDMRPVADTAGFIAVYPQGAIDYDGGGSTSWIHKAPTDHDDIFFVEAIIDALSLEYSIDQSRIYACGYSEGAIFSYELGCRLNDKIAAFAAVSGSMLTDSYRTGTGSSGFGWEPCSPVHPTAMMLIPGTQDFNYHSIYDGLETYYMSVNDITNYWANYNNTDANPVVTNLANSAPNDGSTVEQNLWLNGDNCVSVKELKVINGGHDWPGSSGNMDINASEEIWNFVSQFALEGKIDCISNIEGCTDSLAINFNSDANVDDESCSYIDNSNCENIFITLSQGWNMIGFACSYNTNALIAFTPIQDNIIIVKDGTGYAYLPDYDYNGIGDLERGYGYLIKVKEQINNYNICD